MRGGAGVEGEEKEGRREGGEQSGHRHVGKG